MRTLTVSLKHASYPILIGEGLLAKASRLRRHIPGPALVITQPPVTDYAETLVKTLGDRCVGCYVLPDGEPHKTLEDLSGVYRWLLEHDIGRDVTLVAVGGGVVGDMVGFAAATYMRGVNLVQVPTTLLAQVDSSVGGKTGVNHPLGKNMIGAFWQPDAVLIDPTVLGSQSLRQLRSGMAEVIKYGVLGDAEFFAWLEDHLEEVLALREEPLAYAIETSCACKARVVEADERERSGERALLNLGHSFAHAIETAQAYRGWLHGEAVACGMVCAADLSVRQGWLEAREAERVAALIERCALPTQIPADLSTEELREHMLHDKKNDTSTQRLVLLRGIGEAFLTAKFDPRLVDATLSGVR